MSLEATRWAWRVPVENAGQRLVLVNLADRANQQGQCWPSQRRIARDTCQCERTVRARLDELETLGLIRRQHRKTEHGRTSDLITLPIEGRPKSPMIQTAIPPPANAAATDRKNLPEGTGKACPQIDQDLTNQIEQDLIDQLGPDDPTRQRADQPEPNTSLGIPVWVEIFPEPGRPDIDRYNRAADFATEIGSSIQSVDWDNAGLQSLDLVQDWLARFDSTALRDCLIRTAARAHRAGTRIESWHYFANEVEKLRPQGT